VRAVPCTGLQHCGRPQDEVSLTQGQLASRCHGEQDAGVVDHERQWVSAGRRFIARSVLSMAGFSPRRGDARLVTTLRG